MKRDNTKKLVKDFFETSTSDIDTDKLIKKLQPVISKKCSSLKSKSENYFETVVFTLSCIGAFLTGIFLLFPELIDYTDIIIQFFVLVFATVFVIVAINLIAKNLLPKYLDNKDIKLRGKLL